MINKIENMLEVVVGSIILLTIITVAIFYKWSYSIQNSNTKENLKMYSYNQANKIDSWHENCAQQIQNIKRHIEIYRNNGLEVNDNTLDTFYGYLTDEEKLLIPNGIYVGTADNKFYKTNNCNKLLEGKVINQPWYKEGLKRVDVNYDNVYKDNSDEYVSFTGMIAGKNNNVTEVIGCDVSLKTLKSDIETTQDIGDYQTVIVDRNGEIIVASESSIKSSSVYETNNNILCDASEKIKLDYKGIYSQDNYMIDIQQCNRGDWYVINYAKLKNFNSCINSIFTDNLLIIIFAMVIIVINILKSKIYLLPHKRTVRIK